MKIAYTKCLYSYLMTSIFAFFSLTQRSRTWLATLTPRSSPTLIYHT